MTSFFDPSLRQNLNCPPDLLSQASSVLDSAQLFGQKKLVLIRHNEDWYRLMLTKQNKLILTK